MRAGSPAAHNRRTPLRQGGLRGEAHVEPLPTPRSSEKPPELWTTTPQKGRASPYTINNATMQPRRTDYPAAHDHGLGVALPTRPSCRGSLSPPRLPAPPKKGPWKLVTSAMARSRSFGSAVDYRCVFILTRSPGYSSTLVLVTIAAAVSFSAERTRISPTGSDMREPSNSSPTAVTCPS